MSAALDAFEAKLAGGADAAGYAALSRGGEVHPHTPEAEEIWRQPGRDGPWSEHHRAVLFHAAAYDLELAGDWKRAAPYWARALEHWANVHADDAFWPAVGNAGGVRDSLPADLLLVHADLIAAHVERDPDRARSHVALLRSAPFEAAGGVRDALAAPVFDVTVELVATHDFEQAVRLCRTWLEVDPEQPVLLRALLYAANRWNEAQAHEQDGHRRIARTAAEVDALLGDAVVDGAARHLFWRGMLRMREGWEDITGRTNVTAGERLSRLALADFARARELDPELEHDAFYHAILTSIGDTHLSLATCHLVGGDLVAAMEEWRIGERLTPGSANAAVVWAQAVALDPDSGPELLDTAEAQLLRVRESDADELVLTLSMLDYRRRFGRAGPLTLAKLFGKPR